MRGEKIKKIAALSLLIALSVTTASSQSKMSYVMPNAIEKREYNAAFAPDRGYVNIPLIGAMSLNINGNTTMGDLLFPSDGKLVSFLDTTISSEQALSNLQSDNNFGMSGRIGIVGMGKYSRDLKSFWSADVNLRATGSFSLPYDFFEFVKEAPEQATIGNIDLYMESYIEFAYGYTRKIDDRLQVGGRVKGLLGLMSTKFMVDYMDISMNESEWRASAEGEFELNGAGIYPNSSINSDGVEVYKLGEIEGKLSGISGYGAAIDLGATFDMTDRLQLSFAANDLGFITWGKKSNSTANVANEFNFIGAAYDVSTEGSASGGAIQINDIVLEAQDSRAVTYWLQSSINMGAKYDFFDSRLSAGLLYSIDFWRMKSIHNLTVAGSYTPIHWFSLAMSYAVASNSSHALGFAVNIATEHINIYVATDVLTARKSTILLPVEQSMMNVSLGIAVPFGARGLL